MVYFRVNIKSAISAIVLLLACSNALAGAMAMPMEGIGVETQSAKNPGALGRAIKFGLNKISTAPKGAVTRTLSSCLVSKKLCAGIAATSLTFAYLYEHPEVVADYLDKHPDQYDKVLDILSAL